jgi:hypothetical protein
MRRTLWLPAALAIIAVIVAGCGSGSAGTVTSSTRTAAGHDSTAGTREQAVKFAACMRANGVSGFPDPNASGELTIDAVANGSSVDTSAAAFKQAISTCRDLQPAGFTGHKRSAQQQENALRFAQCMRDNGIKDFPDPTPDGPLIDTSKMPGSPGALSIPGFKAAQEKCGHLASAAGVTRGQ